MSTPAASGAPQVQVDVRDTLNVTLETAQPAPVKLPQPHLFLCWCLCLTASQPITDNTAYLADRQGLIAIRNSIMNFGLYMRRAQSTGWSEKSSPDVCTWPGVMCTDDKKVIGLRFLNNGSVLVGDIAEVLYGASILTNLRRLDLSGQAFTGTLPNNSLSMPQLEELNLANNFIQGSLPVEWGIEATFPKLQNLTLSFNSLLGGTLPSQWGSDGSSLRSLSKLEINNCNVTGTLPAAWAQNLPSLKDINVSTNALTGTLPPSWSTLNLTGLNLDRNLLRGSIPGNWGANGSFPNLVRLQLYSNFLTGSLPAAWNVNGTMPKLAVIDTAQNNFSGVIPQGWGTPGLSFLVTKDNAFCGRMPNYNVYRCGYFRRDCAKYKGVAPECPAPLPSVPQPSSVQSAEGDKATLLRLKSTFLNFDAVARTEDSHWDDSVPMCQWQGVTCTPQGAVQSLNFSIPIRAPPVLAPLSRGYDNAIVHGSMECQLRGDVGEVLKVVSALPQLTKLDFFNQFLTGTLPSNISFPRLMEIRLINNDISGTLPSAWSDNGAFPALRALYLNRNYQLSGTLPASWGSQASSLHKLEVLTALGCNLTGPLPAQWASNLPLLSILDLNYNALSGTLPPEWKGMGAMSSLNIIGNNLQGSLPSQWSDNGARSWPFLQELHLDGNLLNGSLPASWGAMSSMPSIRNITLMSNNLSGPIPSSWGVDGSGRARFSNLQALYLQPGNEGLCGIAPNGVSVFRKAGNADPEQVYSLGGPCPVDITATSTASAAGNSGSVRVDAAITGAVLGGCFLIAVVAVSAWLLVRSSRRRRAQQRNQDAWDHASPHKAFSLDNKLTALMRVDVPQHDSDSIIPPKAPHSFVPFSQAPSSRMSSPSQSGSSAVAVGSSAGSRWLPGLGSRLCSAPGSGPSCAEGTTPGSGPHDSRASGHCDTGSAGCSSSAGAAANSTENYSLPSLPWKDWELNLDALEVELNEDGTEVELGKGAFGVVVKGCYRLAPVAIKRLHDQSPEQQVKFLKEMSILRACRGSRYVVPFVGASLQPGNTILAMDYMDNGNLWDALPRKAKDGRHIFQWNNRGKRVALEIALGLHFLHDLRVAHLDLKSSNVLLAADGTAKISDVGLAALISRSYLSQMAPAGTWAWVAPEVILGGRVTRKADIFSFGVVLWEIVTLERPAWRGNLRDIRVPEEAPQEIADLVSRCTGDVEERPDAQECVEIIGPFVRAGSLRVTSSQPLTPGTVNTPRRTGSGGSGGGGRTSIGGGQPLTPGAVDTPRGTGSGGSGGGGRTSNGGGVTGGGQPLTPGAGGAPLRTSSGGGGSGNGSGGSVGGALMPGSSHHLQQPQQASMLPIPGTQQ
ncbi:probable leucine-rich repeat receptor-like serine/threonine-protein [Coccomyxa sp. Obi]|nr:probable leucine-rich repeat receptor-like serine/threonine-protein [Coccomyxa sp. Obi]